MLKTLQLNAVITGIRSKVDRSLGLSVSTGELSSDEKTAFLDLQGQNVLLTIKPTEEESELLKVDSQLEGKTPSQRLRASMFVLWKSKYQGKWNDFEAFYRYMMERVIVQIQDQIPE